MVDTLKVGGIKLSDELVHIEIRESALSTDKLIYVLQRIAAAEVTIPHLHQIHSSGQARTTLCVAAEQYTRQVEKEFAELRDDVRVSFSTGTITIFPHRFSLELYRRVTSALSRAGVPCLGLSTSVSALVLHCPFAVLEQAVAAVLTECELPENHTPLRPVVLLGEQPVQTVAVYWEPKIRIYGMDALAGLTRIRWQMPTQPGDTEHFRQLGRESSQFRLLLGHYADDRGFHGEMLIEEQWRATIIGLMRSMTNADSSSQVCFQEDCADLVSFHGPHFQDRFGIAERVFITLGRGGVRLLSAGCTGTSVHLVAEAGCGQRVVECLREVCTVPS